MQLHPQRRLEQQQQQQLRGHQQQQQQQQSPEKAEGGGASNDAMLPLAPPHVTISSTAFGNQGLFVSWCRHAVVDVYVVVRPIACAQFANMAAVVLRGIVWTCCCPLYAPLLYSGTARTKVVVWFRLFSFFLPCAALMRIA